MILQLVMDTHVALCCCKILVMHCAILLLVWIRVSIYFVNRETKLV